MQVIGEKRPAPMDPAKKPKTPKKKKKKDPNEPQKPVSAYALFFRDTQAAIKGQNPNATFGEVSKIVASMWDGLGEEQKQVLNIIWRYDEECVDVYCVAAEACLAFKFFVNVFLWGKVQTMSDYSPVCSKLTAFCVAAGLQKQNRSCQEGVLKSPGGLPSQPGVQGEKPGSL